MSNNEKANTLNEKEGIKWAGFSTKWYIVAMAITLAASYTNKMMVGWLGAYTFATLLGVLLEKIGEKTPIVKDYFGGGAMVIIFGSAALVYFKVLPEQTVENLSEFAKGMDYLGWVVGGLICGSILGMDRKLLIKAGIMYFIPILAGVAVAFGLAAVIGGILGYGSIKAILFVALPIMGGGTAAGAVPISQIYAGAGGQDAGYYLSMIMPAVALGNAGAIIAAGLLDRLGKAKPSLSGQGELIKGFKTEQRKTTLIKIEQLGVGFLLTGIFYSIGRMASIVIPVHYYALTILAVAIVKIANILPEEITEASQQWYEFISKLTIPAILVLIGSVYTDLAVVIDALSWQYLILVLATIIGAIIGAGFVGVLLKFYFVEAAVTAGLCMANMGGSGDVATLAAAKRMHLMSFAQISSRLGGAIMILIGSLMASMFAAFL